MTSRRYGIAEFNAKCRESVLRHVDEFEQLTERMGYWVDSSHAYRTMTPEYIESVWWSLQAFQPRACWWRTTGSRRTARAAAPTLSDHEVAQGYETVDRPLGVRPLPASGARGRAAGWICWCGRPRRGHWCPTRRWRCTPRSTYVVARRTEQGTFVVAEPLAAKVLGDDAEILASWPAASSRADATARRSISSQIPDAALRGAR